jgi:hypothetical protein
MCEIVVVFIVSYSCTRSPPPPSRPAPQPRTYIGSSGCPRGILPLIVCRLGPERTYWHPPEEKRYRVHGGFGGSAANDAAILQWAVCRATARQILSIFYNCIFQAWKDYVSPVHDNIAYVRVNAQASPDRPPRRRRRRARTCSVASEAFRALWFIVWLRRTFQAPFTSYSVKEHSAGGRETHANKDGIYASICEGILGCYT